MYPSKYYEKASTKDSRYIFLGNQRLGTIEKVGENTTLYLNFTDHLNSSSVTTDNQGNVTNLIDYMPFGSDRINVQNQGFNPSYKFTDQENDSESGLMNFDARYYEPATGRFPQVDAVAFYMPQITDPQQLNFYSYGRNNPIRYQDPTGNVIIETNDEGRTSMTFETGDTLSQISTMFDMDYQTLADQLGIEDPNKINAGDVYDITDVTGNDGVKIVGTGSIWIHTEDYNVRLDPPSSGKNAKYHGHAFDKRMKNLKQSENIDGTKSHGGKYKPFDQKLRDQLKNDKKWQKRIEESNKQVSEYNTNASSENSGFQPVINPNAVYIIPPPAIIPFIIGSIEYLFGKIGSIQIPVPPNIITEPIY